MGKFSWRIIGTLISASVALAASPSPADATGPLTPLAVAQAAYGAARASHRALSTSELEQAALNADFHLAVFPDGYVMALHTTLPNDHGVALMVNVGHGGFGCVHIGPTIATPPSSVRCPATYLAAIDPNPTVSRRFLLASQVAGAIGVEASTVTRAKSGSAVSSAVPKILNLVSGVTAARDGLAWAVTVRGVSVCLSFTSIGAYRVRTATCT